MRCHRSLFHSDSKLLFICDATQGSLLLGISNITRENADSYVDMIKMCFSMALLENNSAGSFQFQLAVE